MHINTNVSHHLRLLDGGATGDGGAVRRGSLGKASANDDQGCGVYGGAGAIAAGLPADMR